MKNNDIIYINTAAVGTRSAFWRELAVILSAYLAVTGMIAPFAGSGLWTAVFVAVGAVSVFASHILAHRFGDKWYIKGIITAVPIFAAVVMFGEFSRGMLSFFNMIIELWNSRFASQVPLFAAESDFLGNAVFFLVLFSLAADLLCSLGAGKRYSVIFLLIFAEFLAFSFLRVRISLVPMIFSFAAMMLAWEMSVSRSALHIQSMVVTAAAVTAAVVVFSVLFAPFDGSYKVERIKDKVSEEYYNIRYGKDTLPGGDLCDAYKLLDGDDKRLEISGVIPQELYLDGYIGIDYMPDEGRWKQYGGEVFDGEWRGLFQWLDSEGFYPQFEMAEAIERAGHSIGEYSIGIRNIGADRRYLYAPCFVSSIGGRRYRIKNDLSVTSRGLFGTREYSLGCKECDMAAYDLPELAGVGQVLSESGKSGAADVYGGFVRSVYTRLDEDSEKLLNDIFFSSDTIEDETGIYSAVTRIRAVLELRTQYSSFPPVYALGGESDFVDWFLNTAKSGNSVYFATVGTLALRAAGYPARYVEGYHVMRTQENASEVTTKDAHAWSEVYIDRVGWVPVEFTPGFYSETLKGEQTVEISRESAGNGSDDQNSYSMTEEYKEPEPEPETDETFNTANAVIAVILAICAAVILFAAALTVRMRIIKSIRRRHFSQKEPERYIYKHIFKLLALGKVKCDSSRPEECTDAVVKRFAGVRPEEYERMIQLMQKTVFGSVPLEQFEIRSLRKFSAKLTRILYHTSNPIKRVLLRFWYVV